jgi:hypothetical protein
MLVYDKAASANVMGLVMTMVDISYCWVESICPNQNI